LGVWKKGPNIVGQTTGFRSKHQPIAKLKLATMHRVLAMGGQGKATGRRGLLGT
jgi:hypothetical protein